MNYLSIINIKHNIYHISIGGRHCNPYSSIYVFSKYACVGMRERKLLGMINIIISNVRIL
ncbi:hypothetical protein GCM10025859_33520 [Alicyclobacillus fastidiosus]|nr:hypothetical protein GCM10025859_33520 [Alicyclobacillus fastidiosus]